MCVDIKNFYLGTPLDRYEYMKMPLTIFPEHTIQQYNMREHAKNGFIYLEIRKAIYGLPQAGVLANKLLKARLAPAGYTKLPTRRAYGNMSHVPLHLLLLWISDLRRRIPIASESSRRAHHKDS